MPFERIRAAFCTGHRSRAQRILHPRYASKTTHRSECRPYPALRDVPHPLCESSEYLHSSPIDQSRSRAQQYATRVGFLGVWNSLRRAPVTRRLVWRQTGTTVYLNDVLRRSCGLYHIDQRHRRTYLSCAVPSCVGFWGRSGVPDGDARVGKLDAKEEVGFCTRYCPFVFATGQRDNSAADDPARSLRVLAKFLCCSRDC